MNQELQNETVREGLHDADDQPLFLEEHFSNPDGNPDGGVSSGLGFCINWQRGPLGVGDGRMAPNGAFVETILLVVLGRLRYYQETKFRCESNAQAIHSLNEAVKHLQQRTAVRQEAGIEGTHEVLTEPAVS